MKMSCESKYMMNMWLMSCLWGLMIGLIFMCEGLKLRGREL